jgi:capsid protein
MNYIKLVIRHGLKLYNIHIRLRGENPPSSMRRRIQDNREVAALRTKGG